MRKTRRLHPLLLALAASAPILAAAPADEKAWPGMAAPAVEAGNRFAADVYGKLAKGKGNLFLSPHSIHVAVLHKAFASVDEAGTEAAAATAVVMERGMPPPPKDPVLFRADRPFLFLIRHRPTGAILFLGRLVDPSESA